MMGNIFEVKRFAVHDGPGVRTAFFLKGCPLRCRWCHNPEGISPEPLLACHAMKCLHCGECARACRQGAHSLVEGRHAFNRAKCVACGKCVEACLGKALKLYGHEISVEEARKIVLEDRDFYKDGGGCTVSGGEPLLQAEFCAELFGLLKKDGISCAVDTSGEAPWKSFEKVLPLTDIFLYDVKHVDDALHKKFAGLSNRRILSNLEALSELNVPIEIRIPCVPAFNLDDRSMTAIGRFLSGLKSIVGVRLLPYHTAHSKYESVGLFGTMPEFDLPNIKQLDALAGRLKAFNLAIK